MEPSVPCLLFLGVLVSMFIIGFYWYVIDDIHGEYLSKQTMCLCNRNPSGIVHICQKEFPSVR
ncbi:hypothetical protein BDV23DRAFT_158098 [Aspergillus alliaceus]|uniref:Uncharacterized protein n=1 Tax=Petromyces alliaceus TaxID=209559 RepID=A0A5N7C5H8_PETAA|nr:hypothetical protein BDV23DRAFT_158098 [Aspergillus alliaceus]